MDLSLNGIQCFAFKIFSIENMILRKNDDLSFPVANSKSCIIQENSKIFQKNKNILLVTKFLSCIIKLYLHLVHLNYNRNNKQITKY